MAELKYLVSINLTGNELRNAVTQNLAGSPTGASGLTYYDTTLHGHFGYNGTAWRPFDAALLTDGSITNAALSNPSLTIGSTSVALGATVTTFTGLTSVTSTTFVGALTGNASTSTKLASARNIGISGGITATPASFDGSGNVTIGITAVPTSLLTGTIANGGLANSSLTIGSTSISLGATATTIAGLTSVTSTTFVGALTGNASTATTAAALTTARTIGTTGITSTPASFDGSGNVTIGVTGVPTSLLTGTLSATVMPAYTGDVTSVAGAVANTIAAGAVTLAKMASLPTKTLIGNGSTSTATPTAITLDSTLTLSVGGVLGVNTGSLGGGTVTAVSVVSANGFAGSVATSTTTPAITISTSVTGLLKGNGTAISAATAGTDYVVPSGSITGTAGNVTGTVAIANGGTGQTTAALAFAALSPTTTLGDIAYFGASAYTRLAGNTTATKKFLVQTGTGTVSAAPSWGTIIAGDIPTLNQNTTGTAGNVTGVVLVANGGTGATTLTGILKGNGTGAFTAATAGTDYVIPSGSITGSAATLTTSRTIAISGSVTGTATAFNGSTNITIAATSLDLTTTTGSLTSSKISDLATVVKAYKLSDFAAPTANVSMGGYKLTSLLDGSANTDAVTVQQLNAAVSTAAAGIDPKEAANVATTANITLTGTQTIDGISVTAGMRVLVKNQTTASQNGIYICNAGAWTRSTDAVQGNLTSGAMVLVLTGTVGTSTQWFLSTADPITVGTTALTWTQFAAGATYTAASSGGLTLVGNAFAVGAGTGIAVSAGSVAVDTTVVSRHYTTTIGDGTSTDINVTHSLGTLNVGVFLRDTTSNDLVVAAYNVLNGNTVTVSFATAPSSGAYAVTIIG